jgi:hypothetical protein
MKQSYGIAITAICLLINWASPTAQSEGAQFYGILTTREGNTYKVKTLSVGDEKKTKQIAFYERPRKRVRLQKTSNQSVENKLQLCVDPMRALAVTYLDLNEISRFEVPRPDETWVYKAENGSREVEYTEVVIETSGKQKKQTRYLIPSGTKVYCSRIDGDTSEEMKVQLPAIKTITVKGFYYKTPGGASPQSIPQSIKEFREDSPIQAVMNKETKSAMNHS